MGLGVKDMCILILRSAAQQFLHICLEEYNLKWERMVPCHFTPECSNETEQRKEIHWWPLASLHRCRSRLRWCKDQLTPGGQQTNRRTPALTSLGAQTKTVANTFYVFMNILN